MAFMTWNDKLSVGVETLDKQHVVLIETINELHAAMMKGQARAAAGQILHNLVDYTRDHFAAEEAMMELTKQVEEYVARFESGDITLGVHLLNFLSEWLTKHIQGEDQQYGPWMNERGVR